MINVTIYKNSQSIYTGFESRGHAGYAESGQDIVCSAVSALVINTINAIDSFTSDIIDVDAEEESGTIIMRFLKEPSHDSDLLMNALVLGLQTIQEDYNNHYIHLKFEEV